MAILPIILAPDVRLKTPAESVTAIDDSVRTLVDDMFETMYHARGIGLAAVQVGVLKRVIVTDTMQDDTGAPGAPLHFINPEIIAESDALHPYQEGCLSFPGQFADVVRPDSVRIRYQTVNGTTQEGEFDGLLATCLQHEIDHLNGITFVDHLSRLKRDMILRRMKKVKRSDHEPAPYATAF